MRSIGTYVTSCVLAGCTHLAPTDRDDLPLSRAIELQHQGKALVIDIRSSEERQLECILTADVTLQFGQDRLIASISKEENDAFASRVSGIKRGDREIVLLCQYGVRSEYARKALRDAGISARSVAGGCFGR
jgi:rhodanese-related sulfurtransferase